ncbi:MAG: low specificity L-threonine aldolase [Pseudomonadota bacterium]
MDFSSDTSAPAHPTVIEAIAKANSGQASSYGSDDLTAALEAQIKAVFETDELAIWPTASGTAANALALSCICPPTHSILCHEDAHIEQDERGAPEFFTGGAKLALLSGENGKLSPADVADHLETVDLNFVHAVPPAVLSITNLTEWGTVYTPTEISELARIAHAQKLSLHLDGARLANALATLECSTAELTWKSGVDVLTLGLTKTGAIGCEIIVLFGKAMANVPALRARAKRSGHMPPKLRYLSAQGLALLEDGLWLDLARHANAMATTLSSRLLEHEGVSLITPVQGNEVFAQLPAPLAEKVSEAGWRFYPWPGGGYRFVCSWTTQLEDIDRAFAALRD